jgi:cytochrome c-type biogenesis protein CcsB
VGGSPPAGLIRLEVEYNRWAPFRIAWGLMLAATLGCLLSGATGARRLFGVAIVAYVLGLAAMIAGFVCRGLIAGRPPVTNMYESVVYVGAGIALLGLLFAFLNRNRVIVSAAGAAATLALILADSAPLMLDPSLRPLEPVLRSNFWLTTHVLTITLSYAAFALALGLGDIALWHCLVRSTDSAAVAALGRLTYKVLQFGVLLLAVGIVLGGVWADYSWGRFWGWDPKEVWALVALLGYLAVLHARYAGWVGDRGLAALAVACFALVVMGWYGVNFVLGVGLHSYGFGGGGQTFVYGATVLQLLYVAIAAGRTPEPPDETDTRSRSDGLAASTAPTR